MKITVTRHDIDNGKACSCHFCPIARAIERETGQEAGVGAGYGYLGGLGLQRSIFKLTPAAMGFIIDFDAGRPVKPFSFEIHPEGRAIC